MKNLMVLLCLGAACSFAEMQEEDIGQRLVDKFLTEVVTLEAQFEQSQVDADGVLLERNTGTLEIQRPAQFRWSYQDPYEQWLVADGTNIWSYDLDLEQVTVKPQAEALANTPALLLGGSEGALEQFRFVGTTIDSLTTWVRLEPKDPDSGFDRVELGFIDGALRRMVFFDHLGQTTPVGLHDVSVNEPIDAFRFEFSVPPGVDLVGTPAGASAAVQ